jgi:protein-S-isoprenylcysteine O-methyltransferase
LVSLRKQQKHNLITNGIYSFFRHPGYTGYFYYCIFAQIFLGNILSFFAFFVVLIRFFSERIEFEEEALIKFFPEYLAYKKRTYILIPFVKDPDFMKKYETEEEEEHGLA